MEPPTWYSVDPSTAQLTPFPPEIDAQIETAYRAHRPDVHLADFMQMRIVFDSMVQMTPEVPGRRGKQAGVRSVVRARPGTEVHVAQVHRNWRTASNGVVQVAPNRMGGGAWIWEWCEQLALFHARESSWHPYAPEVVTAMEGKWARGGDFEHPLTVGLRNLKVVVDRTEPFYTQVDEEYQKMRWVRRRFRPDAQRPHAPTPSPRAGDACALCCEEYDETPHWPTVRVACGHTFHAACLQPVRDSSRRCPLCRSDLA